MIGGRKTTTREIIFVMIVFTLLFAIYWPLGLVGFWLGQIIMVVATLGWILWGIFSKGGDQEDGILSAKQD